MQKMKSRLNKKLITLIVFCLVAIISIGQDLKILNELKVKEPIDRSIKLSKDFSLTIDPDKDLFNYILSIKSKNTVKLTDTFEITPYGFNFRLFEIENKSDFLLIIEVEYEFTSEYPIYLIKKNEIKKIGNLNIRLDCNDCDVLNYPLSEITVKGNQKMIEFSFTEDLVLINPKKNEKKKYNEIRFVYNYKENGLRIE